MHMPLYVQSRVHDYSCMQAPKTRSISGIRISLTCSIPSPCACACTIITLSTSRSRNVRLELISHAYTRIDRHVHRCRIAVDIHFIITIVYIWHIVHSIKMHCNCIRIRRSRTHAYACVQVPHEDTHTQSSGSDPRPRIPTIAPAACTCSTINVKSTEKTCVLCAYQ